MGEGFFFYFQKIEMLFSHYQYGINMPSRYASQQNEICKRLSKHKILLPTEESRVEDLELVLESISKAKKYGKEMSKGNFEMIKNSTVPSEKQLEIRIRLRKKLEKKKSKKK